MKLFYALLGFIFVSLWSEATHSFDFNLKLEGPRAQRIFSENKLHAEFYDFKYYEPEFWVFFLSESRSPWILVNFFPCK